ncbi:kynureninase [Nocardioides terrisoli]|uniref:kynureninase n=1 Tax=Nocardioides terrisoli TaxID=3388267 RepID=UPI00287B66C0|nr:kynureninase [Nocardioides marmorisolisilvae]
MTSRDEALALDRGSALAGMRGRFDLPPGVIYLDGNSLGALPVGVADRMAEVLHDEWGRGLIRSWNALPDGGGDWMGLSARVARRLAPLLGVAAADVHLGDSTSVTLFKTMVAAARLRPGRRVLVIEPSTFPTDGYIAEGVTDLLGLELRWCDPADPVAAVDEDTALLSLTHVDFRTGAMFDLATVTAAAHERGALVQWDLCHSTGAVPVDLTTADADFAVGCTYKYLNGGPGSPAFAWVAPRHQSDLRQPITGWIGHATPFAMSREHVPAAGIARMASGTPPVLALATLDAALDAFEGVTIAALRATSLSLTDLFIRLLDERLGTGAGVEIVTPREHDRRGSQVSFRHPQAYGIVQALIARGVIGDFRDDGDRPGIARFGFAPLYVRHVDVLDAVDQLVGVLEGEEHLDPSYATRNRVT